VRFEYPPDAEAALTRVLGDTIDFEYEIKEACGRGEIDKVAVRPITAGLSGAAVFLVTRTRAGRGFIPWVVKASKNRRLIIAERENYQRYVQEILPAAPKLIQSTNTSLLIFEYGGALANYDPCTLRSGYESSKADALATLMRRIVTSLQTIDHLSVDTMSCVNRMPLLEKLETQFQVLRPSLTSEVIVHFKKLWQEALSKQDKFPYIYSTAHGDLNSENVLFEPGNADSFPVFIDFASMGRSKDNEGYSEEGQHLPFWDYAKLERDIQTRLFLKEAIKKGLNNDTITEAIKAVNGVGTVAAQTECAPVAKLFKVTLALRESIQKECTLKQFQAYRVVLAYAMLTVFFRKQPDEEAGLQSLVAAESSIALLADPFSPLPTHEKPSAKARVSTQLAADERDVSKVLDHPTPMV
jgi:hypothetical protein